MAGGWTVPPSTENPIPNDLTDEEQAIFDKAVDAQPDLGKGDDQPVAVLATQVVAGTNYAYLCKGVPPSPDSDELWAIFGVYNDLQGNARIISAASIDIPDIETTDTAPDGQMTGAWEIREATSGVAMTAEAAQAFSKASENYDGVQINPLALLGTQVVAGTNYLILGTGPAAADNPTTVLYVATVYEDLQGNAEFTDVSQFNLLAYV